MQELNFKQSFSRISKSYKRKSLLLDPTLPIVLANSGTVVGCNGFVVSFLTSQISSARGDV